MIKNTIEKLHEIEDISLDELEAELGERLHYHYHGNVKTLHDMVVNQIPRQRAIEKRLLTLGVY